MDINELEAFKLSDAVKFHNKLNPNLWVNDMLDPEVREQLLLIAEDFVTTLGISDLDIVDITISGSNAAYSYTPHSDLDLHVLVDMSKLRDDEIYRELFTAKKTLYNDSHDITVHGVPVELYVQDANEPVQSLGEYSVLNDKWIRIPKKTRANFDQAATKAKFDNLAEIVELALKTKDLDRVEKTIDTIKRYRKAGLAKGGEFGPENLAFKAIRKQGGIQDLYDLRDVLRSERLSIEEYANEDYDPNGPPPGPEFKPTMPAGTVKVDVSDVYDWYKLGQHISNMKGLGKHDFGKGPPSTILSFGDEDTEHEYIQDLEKTGLSTTDIDPVDPNQPKGMKRQKTDPTFNVNEAPIKLYTDPNYFGAEVGDYKASGPVVDIPANKLVGFEPDDKMNQPKSKANVKKIVSGLENGDKLPPILVRKYKNGYQVVDGHHRFWAYKLLGIKSIPAQIVPDEDIETVNETADRTAAVLKIQKYLNKKYGANLDLDGKLGPLTLKSINKFMPRAKKGLADEPNKTTRVQGKKLKEAPRTFQSQTTPLQQLILDYGYFTSFGTSHLEKQGTTPEAQKELLSLIQRLQKDSKSFDGLDKDNQKMEANRDTILNHVHQMMQYAIPILKKNLPADKWEAKRSQINKVLQAYNSARQIKEEQLDETAEENQIVNVVSNIAAAEIAKVMKAKESKLLKLLDMLGGETSPKDKLELFGMKVKDLNVPKVNNPLLKKLFNILYIKVNSQLDFYDDPSAPKTLGGYYDGDYTVELFFPAIEYVAGKRESQLKSEIASTLAHEIQHAIDDYKSDNKVYAGSNISPAKDLQGYLKLPYEVNARFQEATMDIAKYITMPKKDGSKTTQNDLPELIRYAFEKNRLDKIYEKNQKEYKRLLSRAYKFFQAELNAPKQATPIPQSIAKRALAWILGKQAKEINEASGYIPSEKEKNDPRFKTALTVDVKPDSIKKNAKAFNWKTSRAGIPPQARADGKIAEDLMREWKKFLAEDEEQQELFPGYDKKHREERLNKWLGKSHAMAGKKPQVLYHATTADFDQFRVQNQGWVSGSFFGNTQVDRTGIFLAQNPKFAEEFIKNNGTGPEWKENARIIPVYLSAQYPFSLLDDSLSPMLSDEATVEEFKAHDIDLWSIYRYFSEDKRWELFDGPEGEEFVSNLKRLGYDSAVMREEAHSHGGSEVVWVAFDPAQVKAITNRGSFSPDDPRLMRENG